MAIMLRVACLRAIVDYFIVRKLCDEPRSFMLRPRSSRRYALFWISHPSGSEEVNTKDYGEHKYDGADDDDEEGRSCRAFDGTLLCLVQGGTTFRTDGASDTKVVIGAYARDCGTNLSAIVASWTLQLGNHAPIRAVEASATTYRSTQHTRRTVVARRTKRRFNGTIGTLRAKCTHWTRITLGHSQRRSKVAWLALATLDGTRIRRRMTNRTWSTQISRRT